MRLASTWLSWVWSPLFPSPSPRKPRTSNSAIWTSRLLSSSVPKRGQAVSSIAYNRYTIYGGVAMGFQTKPAQLTAPETAYRWLRDAISTLPWDEEAFLSENAVAEASGTSRTPVREALLRLEASGLVRRVPHKGAYVPALSSRDLETMMEARQVIEEWAVRKVTGVEGSVDEMNRLLDQQAAILADPVAFIECDIQFHKYIVELADNPVLQDVYESQRFKQLRMGVKAV